MGRKSDHEKSLVVHHADGNSFGLSDSVSIAVFQRKPSMLTVVLGSMVLSSVVTFWSELLLLEDHDCELNPSCPIMTFQISQLLCCSQIVYCQRKCSLVYLLQHDTGICSNAD